MKFEYESLNPPSAQRLLDLNLMTMLAVSAVVGVLGFITYTFYWLYCMVTDN